MSTYTPMIQQYLQIKAQYKDCFLFFRLGDFYELFFDDALLAAKELEITLTSRMGGKEERVPMCGVPHHSADQYIKKLIDKGYKVAICEQVEDPREAKGVVKREVVRVITPGTLVEENFLVAKENNYILFLGKEADKYALVSCDMSTGELMGTDNGCLEQIVEELSHFRSNEIIIDDRYTEKEIAQVKQLKRVALINVLAVTPVSLPKELTSTLEAKPLSGALSRALQLMYLYLTNTQKRAIEHLQPFQYYQSDQYLLLDSFSKRNLELLETIRDQGRKGSLIWLLDETATAMGGRLIKKWLQRPLMNLQAINRRLDMVESLVHHAYEREELREALKEVYDIERLAARVSFGNVNPRDLLQLKKSLQQVPAITGRLASLNSTALQDLAARLDPCQELALLLEKAIDEEAPPVLKEGGIFKRGYHAELDRLWEASQHGKQWIAELEAKERERTGIKSLKVGYNRVFGYYIEVTKANVPLLDDSRYERKQTLANAERYITPELKEMEALILDASERMLDLEYELFQELRNQVHQYTPRLQKLAQTLAELDVFCSLAKVSEENRYVRPTFNLQGDLRIMNGRHPVVEKVLADGVYVPNHVEMDDRKRQILLITGPNMAGKSTYMRQVALTIILAQIGCFVPADEANLPIFDQIFTRIGAADDLVGGQSTFMVEMLETKQAITRATSRSLILLDEIGRGTSTYDGMSLAQAVVEYIHDHVQAKTLFSTHYHELTVLEESLERLTNIHVACSEKDGQVIFLHTVKEGKADQSYGIHVAQLADLPKEVIDRAREVLAQLEAKGNQQQVAHQAGFQPISPSQEKQLSLFPELELAMTIEREQKPEQLVLKSNYAQCIEEIKRLDIATMTPLEALNILFRLQQKLKE